MVQWLKPCTSNTVGTGSILGQGTKIPWVTCAKKEKKRQSSVNLLLEFGSPFVGEGNGTLLQYSCLESPMDGGAW